MLHKHRCPGIEKTSTHLQKQALRNLALPVLQDCDFLAAQQTISTAQNYDFVRSGLVAAVLLTRSLRQARWGDVSESTSVEATKEVPGTCEARAKGRWEGEDRKVRGGGRNDPSRRWPRENNQTSSRDQRSPEVRTCPDKTGAPSDWPRLPNRRVTRTIADYCFAPPKAPRRQDLQIPKPVPLAWMKLQSAVIPANSEPAIGGTSHQWRQRRTRSR